MVITAGVGGRILSAIILTITGFNDNFFENLFFGASVFYGGLLLSILVLFIYCRIKKQSFISFTDLFATILPLGQAIGRFGCFLNGCCYGIEYNGFLSIDYNINGKIVPTFPTWFLEAFLCLALFFYFQIVSKNLKKGYYTLCYLIYYPTIRFFIEFFRGDSVRGIFGILSTSQIISIIIIIACIPFIIIYNKRKVFLLNNIFFNSNK